MAMAGITKKDIFDTLTEFYGKIIEPEFKAIRTKLEGHDQKFRDILQHFDEIYKRLERLETEYYAINAAIDRMEKRLDKERLEGEVADLKQRISTLQERVEDLEKRLKTFS